MIIFIFCVSKRNENQPHIAGDDYVDPEDPNVIAENELLDAAASIEAAAKKLALLQPRKVPRVRVFSCLLVMNSQLLAKLEKVLKQGFIANLFKEW